MSRQKAFFCLISRNVSLDFSGAGMNVDFRRTTRNKGGLTSFLRDKMGVTYVGRHFKRILITDKLIAQGIVGA